MPRVAVGSARRRLSFAAASPRFSGVDWRFTERPMADESRMEKKPELVCLL